MPTKKEIEDAYKLVRAQETKIVSDVDALATEFNAKVKAICDALPEGASATAAGQLVARVQGAVSSVFGYDLLNTKAQYGLNDTAA